MDVAVFTRSRARLWAWMLAPAILTAAVHFSVREYGDHIDRSCTLCGEADRRIPGLEEKLHAVRESLRHFTFRAEQNLDVTEVTKSRLTRTAQESSFAVNSLNVEKSPAKDNPKATGSASSVVVHLTGEGSLAAVVRLLNDAQGIGGLMKIESAQIRMMRLVAEPLYSGDFALRYYLVTM